MTKTLLIAIDYYGELPFHLKREYSSVEEFQETMNEFIYNKPGKAKHTNIVLMEVRLHESETYYINSTHQGERIHFKKAGEILSSANLLIT